jgi:ribosomal protein S18 acetylase RimI-like enzyme
VNLDGLWARLDQLGRIELTVLAVPSPGRTAMVFATHPANDQQALSLGGVLQRACRELATMNVNLAQALLDPGQSIDRKAFVAGGFRDLAMLSYLERPLRATRSSKQPQNWPANTRVAPYENHLRTTLLEILSRSYEETLDCPGLRGYRKTEDIFEGHRASGLFDPALWTLLYVNDEPSGAALLNPSADRNSIELVYLGLVKAARGSGLGKLLLRHAIGLLEGRAERTIHLAVDEANAPALALYRQEGFRAVQRRRAMIHPLAETAAT